MRSFKALHTYNGEYGVTSEPDRYSTLKLKVTNMSSDDSRLSLSCEMILLVNSGWSIVCTFTGQLRFRNNWRSHYSLLYGHISKHVVSHIRG